MDISNKQIGKPTVRDRQSSQNLVTSSFAKGVAEQIFMADGRRHRFSVEDLTDVFHALESPVVEAQPNPKSPEAVEWWKEFLSSPKCQKIRAKTVGNPHIAELCTIAMAKKLRNHLTRKKHNPPKNLLERFQQLDESIDEVAEDIDNEADEAIMLCNSITYGLTGAKNGQIDKELFESIFDRVRNSEQLREILKLAGAMHQFRGAKRKQRVEGMECVNGVTHSGELSKLTPSEMLCLADDDLSDDLMRRLVERQALSFDKYSLEKSGSGPMVVVIDESGSMDGEPIAQAKAFALVMARIAANEKRWVQFVSFSGYGKIREELFKPEDWKDKSSQERLLSYLEHFFSGGTNFSVLDHVVNNWKRMQSPKGKTDIYIITDMEATLDDGLVHRFNTWKHEYDVKSYGLAIASGIGDLEKICDHSWPTQSCGLESSSVRQILSTN